MIHYETINFFNDFRHNGYVLKVLSISKFGHIRGFYYNDRAMTEVPCIDDEIFIISNHNHENKINTYTLIQIDFSIDKKYKILLQKDTNDIKNTENHSPKKLLEKYILENGLVEVTVIPPKGFQIEDGMGNVLQEVFENLLADKRMYTEKELFQILLNNIDLSKTYQDKVKVEKERKKDKIYASKDDLASHRRIRAMSRITLDMIFDIDKPNKMTIEYVLMWLKRGKENYHYNI